jgi:hypothetical protein
MHGYIIVIESSWQYIQTCHDDIHCSGARSADNSIVPCCHRAMCQGKVGPYGGVGRGTSLVQYVRAVGSVDWEFAAARDK